MEDKNRLVVHLDLHDIGNLDHKEKADKGFYRQLICNKNFELLLRVNNLLIYDIIGKAKNNIYAKAL